MQQENVCLVLIVTISYFRKKIFQRSPKDDLSLDARERNSIMGLVLPQKIETIWLDCGNIIKIDRDSGDFTIVIIMFAIIVLSVIFLLFK